MSGSVKMRQIVEKEIAAAAIKGIIDAGYFITVHNGEEDAITVSRDVDAIIGALYQTDEDTLIVINPMREEIGWVKFIYGNDGWDVIHDYAINLEEALKPAFAVVEKYR
jgi:hypothetical protein